MLRLLACVIASSGLACSPSETTPSEKLAVDSPATEPEESAYDESDADADEPESEEPRRIPRRRGPRIYVPPGATVAQVAREAAQMGFYLGRVYLLSEDGSHPTESIIGRLPDEDVTAYVTAFNAVVEAGLAERELEHERARASSEVVEVTGGAETEGREAARRALRAGRLELVRFDAGTPTRGSLSYRHEYDAILARAGIHITTTGNCSHDEGKSLYAHAFNEVMEEAIARRRGRHFLDRARARASARAESARVNDTTGPASSRGLLDIEI